MISRFFIDRPIFAAVLSIVVTLCGGIALFNLPIAMYPPIAPPTVSVDCNYPGASAQVVSESVAVPIEQQVNGVEDMLYMSSQCTNDGSYNLTVTFKHGVDLNLAQVLVQNRVSLALPRLPDVLKQTGVNVKKRSPDILLAIALNSPDKSRTQLYLSNYATLHIRDEIARMPGVSDVNLLGQRDYSMRVWVDPEKLAARGMSAGDVVKALREQNVQVAAGQVGQPPAPNGQARQYPIDTLGRLSEPEQFERVIVKSTGDGRVVRIRDVARVELGSKNEDISVSVNGKPSITMAIFQLPDANALDTANELKAKMEELKLDFPDGVDFEIRYDTTPFISESIGEVFKTLQEAIILVALVVLLFLQNWRSTLIPLVAVPVAIVGTFAAMAALGFSLNNLTLFGLVLAIGIVVDDAIVVVEAVEHHLMQGLSPRDATIKAMDEVSGPVAAIGLVLTAVFVPCAFISGIVGQFFRQFALTIAVSTVISTFNSLTLSPALAALLLRPHREGVRQEALPRVAYAALAGFLGYEFLAPRLAPLLRLAGRSLPWWGPQAVAAALLAVVGWLVGPWVDRLLTGFFRLFNAAFRWLTGVYVGGVGLLLRGAILVLIAYVALLTLTTWLFGHTPAGFIPSQDMGYLLINTQMPDSTSAERNKAMMDKIEKIAKATPGIKHTQAISGQSLLLSANGSNFGSMFVILDEFKRRRAPELYGEAIQKTLRGKFAAAVPEAMITVLGPPPVRGVGRAGGFKMMIEDRGDYGSVTLQGQADNLVEKGAQQPGLVGLTSVFRANVPQLFVDVNRTEAMIKKVALGDLFDTLRVYLGSIYVNDINRFGRTWQVVVQAESRFRNQVDDVRRLKVRNAAGQMVPVGTLANVKEVNGPLVLTRYNMYPAAPINGAAAMGVSSGQAIKLMDKLSDDQLLRSMSHEWTELAYLEIQAGSTAMVVFGLAVVMVFLVLAFQYESWSLPLAVILVVPMCLLSGIEGVRWAKLDVNIFTQIGFVVLVGLASKNAILIVEFAKMRREAGASAREAALDACRLRLRPIIMTSLAFILGVVPLIASQGAGAEMRRTLGTTVFSGMLGVTFFGIFLTPVFFFVVESLGETRLFRSAFMRALGRASMGALRLPVTALKLARRVVKPAARPPITLVPTPSHEPDHDEPAEVAELVDQR